MAKVIAPLLSMGASGQIGKTQVFSNWRGTKYVRRYVIPANPKTTQQDYTRSIFLFLNETWKLLAPAVQAVWTAFAKGKAMTDRNMWQKSNLPSLRNMPTPADPNNVPLTTLETMTISPGVNAGLGFASVAASSPGAGEFTMTPVAPALPAGWAIVKAHAVAFKSQNASTDTDYTSYYGSNAVAPYAVALTDLPTATYDGFLFFEYTKPDGTIAYSPSLEDSHAVA